MTITPSSVTLADDRLHQVTLQCQCKSTSRPREFRITRVKDADLLVVANIDKDGGIPQVSGTHRSVGR